MFLVISALSLNIAFAQYETFAVDIVGDTVVIGNTNIKAGCLASYVPEVTIVQDSIAIIERDTTWMHAPCYCFYDVSVSFTGLNSGNYHVALYRAHKVSTTRDTAIFVGSLMFSINADSGQQLSTNIFSGPCHQFPIVSVREDAPVSNFVLLSNYPNPFNPMTSISFSIPNAGLVNIEVYDALGRVVTTLMHENKKAGHFEVQFNGSTYGSGVYFCRLVTGKTVLTTKLLMLK